MKSTLVALSLLGLQIVGAVEGDQSPKNYEGRKHPTLHWEIPDVTKKDKTGEWRMWYIAKGTRSEGLHGIIIIGGKVVNGKALKETMSVDGERFVWLGPWDDRKQLFSMSGWLPEDLKSVYPSWQIKKAQSGPRE